MVSPSGRHPLTSYAANLHRLVAFRLFLHSGEFLLTAALALIGAPPASLLGLAVLVGTSFLINGVTAWRLTWTSGDIPAAELLVQLGLDVINLFSVFYFTGGATNPFAFLLLLPVVLGATALPERYTWPLTAVAVAAYTLLLFFHQPLPGVDPTSEGAYWAHHVWGMWLGFVLGAGLMTYFLVRMGNTLRAHDQRLARERERALRDEHILALGTLAASTAHELATPLGTLLLLIQEQEEAAEPDEAAQQRLAEMRAQVERCRQALSELSARAGQFRAEGGQPWSLTDFLSYVVDQWQDRRPEAEVSLDLLGVSEAPTIVADRALAQALTNILDNAADASPEAILVRTRSNPREGIVEVCDRGPGIGSAVPEAARKEPIPVAGSEGGLGLGLFLTHAIIARFKGSLELENRTGGGTCARVRIPLNHLGKEEEHA